MAAAALYPGLRRAPGVISPMANAAIRYKSRLVSDPSSIESNINTTSTIIGAAAASRSFSSFGDALSDLLRRSGSGGRSPRADELNLRRFQVTRLNDVLASGLSDLVETASGPASAEASRSASRARRSQQRWEDLLRSVPAEGGRRDRAAAALEKFEKKESQRSERLGGVMDAWREKRLGAVKDPSEETYAEKFFKLFRKDGRENPKKALAQRLDNEIELLEELRRCDADAAVVREVLRGAGIDIPVVANVSKERDGKQPKDDATSKDKSFVYVLDFRGDTGASQTPRLAEEISALLSLPAECHPSEVILRLKSPGGTVTGYGLAAAQLMRLVDAKVAKGNNITLTVCVDEVAASGGYLMACTASRILCSPFAAIGSIGVVASTPNVAKRLESEGLSVVQKTAGKYKRTVTPWKEPQPEELEKLQSDVDDIQRHFIGHVARRRGKKLKVAVDDVATGEVWFGTDALDRGLVDDIMTSEEYIQSKIRVGFEVLHVRTTSGGMSLPSFLGGANIDEGEVIRQILPALRDTGSLAGLVLADDSALSDETLLSRGGLDQSNYFAELSGSPAPRNRKGLLEAIIGGAASKWR